MRAGLPAPGTARGSKGSPQQPCTIMQIWPSPLFMPPKRTPTSEPAPPTPQKPAVRVRPVPAVSRSIAILRFLGNAKQGLGVKAIADELGLVPSTCLHILRVLVSEELVSVDPATKRYLLGSGMISLARSVLESSGFAQLVQPALEIGRAHV